MKGRARVGEVALSDNEYKTAERLKKDYWLYVAYNCGTTPELHHIHDPARLGWQAAEQSTAPINQMLSRIRAKFPGRIELLQPVDYFCDAECPVVKDGVWALFRSIAFYGRRIEIHDGASRRSIPQISSKLTGVG